MKLTYSFLFLFLFTSSCGTKVQYKAPTLGKPSWFKMPERFHPTTDNQKIHPFFDLNPFWNFTKGTVNFFLIDKIKDRTSKKLDLISGNIYKDKLLCYRKDIWKKRNVKLDEPDSYRKSFLSLGGEEEFDNRIHYSFGIIPRTLNSINLPLEVIVLGNKDYFYYSKDKVVGQKIKIIGSVVFQECSRINCIKSQNWLQREILIGVNPFDNNFKSILTIKDLKKEKYDFLLKKYLENFFGGFFKDGKSFPTSRAFRFISSKIILNKIKSKNTIFSINKISSLKKNCFYLYDYIWKNIKSLKEVKKNRKKRFARLFGEIYQKYNQELKTCFQYVSASNINDDSIRHWFFEYLKNLVNLSKLGINYNCHLSYWDYENTLLKSNYQQCSYYRLDQAFRYSINVNKTLANKFRSHYRYITYDNGQFGTHNKIYSWVKDNGKRLNCNLINHDEHEIFPINVNTLNVDNL